MPLTYLALTNKLLVSFGEVPFENETEFATPRSTQARAKDAIKSAVNEINQQTFEWPFNAVEKSDTLIKSTEEYALPTDTKVVDWESFILVNDGVLNTKTMKLTYIDRDEWYDRYRGRDMDSGSVGINRPTKVFPSHGLGYGVSPSPDQPYQIKFRYFKTPSELINANDTTTIPVEFENVIIAGAAWYMHLFRDNSESTQIIGNKFKDLMSNMRLNLLGNYARMRDTRVRF